MLSPRVMGGFPPGIDDRTLPGLDNAIASAEPGFRCGVYEVQVGPIIAMMMYVIGDLAE